VTARGAVPNGQSLSVAENTLIYFVEDSASPELSWRVRLRGALHERWVVLVDAESGGVRSAYSEVATESVNGSGTDLFGLTRPLNVWRDGSTHFLVNASKPMFDPSSMPPSNGVGVILIADARNEEATESGGPDLYHVTSPSPTSWSLRDGVSASFSISETYDYYLERHGRNSIDGQGGTLLGIVRYGLGYQNAFWSSPFMVFGDAEPFAGALDVVAHEMTHGVVGSTAGLIYRNQSGALNEAFADIFGEATEARTNGSLDWLTGAQLGSPLRNMREPASFPICCGRNYPSNMTEFIQANDPFLDNFVGRDSGGVHLNSSIIDRTFYLLAEGLASGGIGLVDAERVFYRTLTTKLVANSTFLDARLGAIASAEELFGVGSTQALKTARAFDVTQIFDGTSTDGSPPSYPGTDGADSTIFVFTSDGKHFLGRRESALEDPQSGVLLSETPVAPSRNAVAGDGSFLAFVDETNDVCLIATGGYEEACLGFPGEVASVAVAPRGSMYGFVLRDPTTGEKDNAILVIDLASDTDQYLSLTAPAPDADTVISTIQYARAMDFTADGRFVIYDALNLLSVENGEVGAWGIYAIDLANGDVHTVLEPKAGFDFAYPALSQTSDGFMTFDFLDQETGESLVVAANLLTGDAAAIGIVNGFAKPGYTGDDSAIVFALDDPSAATGFSLVRQPLQADRLTPNGSPTVFLADADFGTVYRRGAFVPPDATLVSAVLPLSRSVQIGHSATVFAAIINTGNVMATGCNIVPLTGIPGDFVFRTTNPATNEVMGSPNLPADIPAGGLQTFVMSITPTAPVSPTNVQLSYSCENADPANIVSGINTLQFSADAEPVPDVIALVATPTGDGISVVPGVGQSSAFAVATANVGAPSEIVVSADTGGISVPVDVMICESNPLTGACLASPSPTVTTYIDSDATPTFSVFVQALNSISFDPAVNRVFLRFRQGEITRGATSVAVVTN